jgi:GNAT superfamily N-acetyltransferase
VLLGGDHAAIERWRRDQRILRTAQRRPELLPAGLSARPPFKTAGVKIRTGEVPRDAAAASDLWRGSGVALGTLDEPFELERALTRDPDLFVVAASGARVVGAVLGGWDGRLGTVYGLAVTQGRRRQGIGSALLAEVHERLRLKGCRHAQAVLPADAGAAGHVFERLGWAPQSSTVMTLAL